MTRENWSRAAQFCQAESLTYLRPGIWYAATMTVTLSAPPRRRASSSRVWAASFGIVVCEQDFGDRGVVDHVGQAVAAKQEPVAVGEAEPADVALDLAVMAAQEVGEHVALAVVADLFGGDIAGVGHGLGDGVVLGQELECPFLKR